MNDKFDEFIASLSEHVTLKVMESSEIRLDIKCPKETSSKFSQMLEWIEDNKLKYNIATYGFGDSNLGDVFLSVGKLNTHHNENNNINFEVEINKVTGVVRWFYHEVALLIKR